MEKFIKVFKAEIKGIDENDHTVLALVSSKKEDRDGDIVMPDAFTKGLKSYKEHAVLLSSHNYSDLRKQIGEAVSVKVVDDGLEAKFRYFVGGEVKNDEAEWAWVLAKKGVSAYSIGFIGKEFEWIKIKDADGTERISGRRFTNVELLEISQVLVPSNRDALQSRRSMATQELELCEMAIKSMDKGEIDPNYETAKKIAITLAKEQDENILVKEEVTHYSDALLGAEEKSISEPLEKGLDIADIKEAIKQAVKQKE